MATKRKTTTAPAPDSTHDAPPDPHAALRAIIEDVIANTPTKGAPSKDDEPHGKKDKRGNRDEDERGSSADAGWFIL